ncbi:CID domain-containing protein [Trichonephila clavipes]|nr:CID domain-containing protein [Trichonephila clavipes]
MEKKLTEKAQNLPSPVINGSPCFSDGICASPTNVIPPADSCSRTSTKVPLSPSYEKEQVNLHGCTFSGKLANNDFSENFEEFTNSSKRPEQAPKKKFNKLAELFSESKLDTDKVKRYNSNELSKSNTNKEMLTSGPLKDLLEGSVCEQNNNISELKSKNVTNQQTEEPMHNIQQSPHKKMDTSNQQTNDISKQLKKGSPIKSTENITAAEGDANEIDFLLEESYDSRKVKPSTSIKRKIELLLNSRGKKICTDSSSEQISDDKSPVNNPTPIKKSLQKRKKSSEHIKDHENNIIHNFKEINEKENVTRQNEIISQNLLHPKPEEKLPQGIQGKDSLNFNVKENIIEEQKPKETCNLLTLTSDNVIDCENSNFPIDKNVSNSSSNDKDILGKENKEINLSNCTSDLILKSESLEESIDGESLIKSNNSFLNSTLLSVGSSLSVEFLKDIFQKTNCNPPSDVLNNSVKEPLQEEDKINSTEVKDCDSSFYNLKLLENMDSNDHIKNISHVDTKEVYSSEGNPSSVDTIMPQTEVQENLIKNEIDVQEDNKTDAAKIISYDRMSQNPNNSESVESCKLEMPFLEKKCEENNENGVSSKSSPLHLSDQFVTLAANEKPNLLFTLQNVLHCIAEKKFSDIEAQNSVQGTTMSFEDCLKIYHALNYDPKVSNNTNSSNSHLNLTSTKTSASNRASSDFGNKDDLEVMDMECDSDE